MNFNIKQVTPEMEAWFIAFALGHGTNPERKYGIDRVLITRGVSTLMLCTKPKPAWVLRVERASKEVGVGHEIIFDRIADAYLEWLYQTHEACQ